MIADCRSLLQISRGWSEIQWLGVGVTGVTFQYTEVMAFFKKRNLRWSERNDTQLSLMGLKSTKKRHRITSHPNHSAASFNTEQDGSALSCFFTKFWPDHPNAAAEIETHPARQPLSNLLLSNFRESVWIVASLSCSWLTITGPCVADFLKCSTLANFRWSSWPCLHA